MKSATKTIFVNPVSRISAQGRDKQVFTIYDPKTGEVSVTKSMNKTKEFGAGTTFSFPYNFNTNRLETGLDKNIINPVFGMTPEEVIEKYELSHTWYEHLDKITKQQEIKKQTFFEMKHKTEPGFYTPELANGSIFSNMGALKNSKTLLPSNFLEKFSVILYDHPNRFTDETPRGELAIELCQIHNKIAKTRQYVNNAVHDFYISEENEAEEETAKKQQIINDAIFNLVKLQREGGDYKNYQTAILLTDNRNFPIIKGKVTPAKVSNELSNYINTQDKFQLENISKFNKIMKLLDDKEGRTRFNVMYLVQQAVNTDVIRMVDGYYVWNSKSGTPNMYKHNNYDKFISLLTTEFKTSSDNSLTNWYNDLLNEVKEKNIWFE